VSECVCCVSVCAYLYMFVYTHEQMYMQAYHSKKQINEHTNSEHSNRRNQMIQNLVLALKCRPRCAETLNTPKHIV